jgi:hypothetical protein
MRRDSTSLSVAANVPARTTEQLDSTRPIAYQKSRREELELVLAIDQPPRTVNDHSLSLAIGLPARSLTPLAPPLTVAV